MSGRTDLTPLGFLDDNLERRANAPALMSGDTAWTWRELEEEALRFAAALVRAGVGPGDRVAYASDEASEGFAMLFGIWRAGCVASPMNMRLPSNVLADILETLAPRALLAGQGTPDLAGHAAGLTVIGAQDRPDAARGPLAAPAPDSTAMVFFTSGSTGRPKGVVSTHRAIALNALRTSEFLGIAPDDRILINTPHYYTSAVCHLLTLACRGGSLVSWRDFLFWEDFTREVGRRGCTGFGGAPAHFVRLFSEPAARKALPLRFLVSSGDHLPQHLALEALRACPGARIFRIYGLSEVAGRLCILDPALVESRPDSVGRPLPGMSVAVLREDGSRAEPGEIGEIHVQGDMLASEYLGSPAATANLRKPLGFPTGDCGFLDAEGLLHLRGRKDDVFKSGGEKVSCLLIQQELMRLGLFADAAVLPVEDELLGKVAKAFLVMAEGAVFNRMKVLRALSGRLPNSALPRHFVELSAIPRTGSGKVERKALLAAASTAAQGRPA
jgi:acyl-CoA synthetase (AMP-forming)/AMP-acid ligase II